MNGKILVKVDIDTPGALTDGEFTTVSLARSATTTPQAVQTATIPLTAVKITPQGPVVFTVASSTLSAQSVTLGTILGDRVVIASGITPDTQIVTDARGLSTGETVIVDTP